MVPEIAQWDSFYGIVGSSAGTLIGLQFVAMTLLASRPQRPSKEASHAFATPTIVHFSVVLLLSAFLRAPWQSIFPAEVLWGLIGFGGVVYAAMTGWRMRKQSAYRPECEDWMFHFALPLAAYATIAAASLTALSCPGPALFGAGAAALLLLFTGIHNAWDSVVYHILTNRANPDSDRREEESSGDETHH
jgi:hypothetical protein